MCAMVFEFRLFNQIKNTDNLCFYTHSIYILKSKLILIVIFTLMVVDVETECKLESS